MKKRVMICVLLGTAMAAVMSGCKKERKVEEALETTTDASFLQHEVQEYGEEFHGAWDCEGTLVEGMDYYIGRSVYTNKKFAYSLKIPTTAKVWSDDFLYTMSSDAGKKLHHVLTGDEKGIFIGGMAYNHTYSYDISSEDVFLQDRIDEWSQGSYTYGEIKNVNIGDQVYRYLKEQDGSGTTCIYLVKKCGDYMLEISFSSAEDIDFEQDCLEYVGEAPGLS